SLIEIDGRGCFLKLYLPKYALQKAGFQLHIARGLRAFDAGRALHQAGLAVAQTRACLLVPEGVLLMTEALAGSRDLREIASAEFDGQPAVSYLTMAAEALSDLHREGYKHGDCKWSNLLLSRDRMYFVDLERVKKMRSKLDAHKLLHRKQLVDVARFTADAERFGIESDDFATFVTRYCRGIDCDPKSLLLAVRPHLESTRQRHLQRYGAQGTKTLL
ncbi:MAG: lipopolysaccharide kinase InaA family protein, partial [Pseudomonadota bacterium]